MSKAANYQLKDEREKRGWSQARVAEQIGTDAVNVSRWERGHSTPSPYFREKLCQLYGKNAQDLGFLDRRPKEVNWPADPSPEPVLVFPAAEQNIPNIEKPNRSSRTLACLGYLFLWISGIIVFLFTKEDRFVRFHSLQSTLFFGGSNLLSAVILALWGGMLKIVNSDTKMILTISSMVLLVVFALINLFTLIGWGVGMVQAWRGNYYSFPFFRRLEDRI